MAQDELDFLLRDVPATPPPRSTVPPPRPRSQGSRLASRAVKPQAMFSPDLSAHVDDMRAELSAQGYDVRLGDTLRTPRQQAEKVAQGVSRTYNSRHLTGRAADLVVYHDGQPDWDTNNPAWSAIGEVAKKRGLRWGGDFQSLYDPGHVELGGGDSLDDLLSALPAAGQGDELGSLLGELPPAAAIAGDEIIRAEATVDRSSGQPLAFDDGRRRLPVDAATVSAIVPQSRQQPAAQPDIYTAEGRAQRDATKRAAESPNARFEIDVRLPEGRSDWSELSGSELAQAGVRQWAERRQIPSEFVEQWLQKNGDFRLYDADGEKEQTPTDYIGTEFYDPQARTIRVSALGPQLKQLEREYQSSRNAVGRAADFLTSDETTAGEKFLGVAAPAVEGAARAGDILTRPLQAASTGFWSTVRGRNNEQVVGDIKTEFLTGETNEGAGNYLAEKVAGSETLKDLNPNLPGMAGAVTEVLTDPTNLLPAGLLTKTGRGLVKGTNAYRRVEQALKVAGDARVADSFRRGGAVRASSPVPESQPTLAAQFRSAIDTESPRAAVLVTPGERASVPAGFAAIPVEGGTLHLNRAKARTLGLRTAAEIKEFIAENGYEPLIGKVSPVADTSTGRALRTEDAAGRELATSVVTTPDAARAQAAVDRAQFPQAAAQEVMPAQKAVRRRLEEGDHSVPPPPSEAYGAQNRLVNVERAAAARARVRQKLNPHRLHAGIDPTVLADMAEIAAFHVEAGARDFASFSARMIEEVGDEVQPYLRDLFDHSFTRLDLTPAQDTPTAATASAATPARTPLPEIISSVRKAGLLTGLKTHARNVLGTAGFQAAEEAARVPAAVADIIVSTATGRRTVGGPGVGAALRSSRAAATKGVREARQIMKRGIDDAGRRQLQVTAELNSGSRLLDAYTNTVFRALNAEDRIFRTYALARSLEDQARVLALNEVRAGSLSRAEMKARASELRQQPTPQMQTQALADAEFATFNNDNFVTSNFTAPVREQLKQSSGGRWANAGIDLVLPFDRTPTNIIARILEYSGGLPASLGQLGYRAAAKKITGRVFTEADQRAFAQTFGRGAVGATLLTLGYVLRANGLMTGLYDDEQDERGRNNVQRAAGQPPMSVRIGDTWHQVGAFSPLGNLLAIGATLHRERTQPLKDEDERAGRMFDIGKDVLMQQPLLQAAREVTEDGRAGERLGRVAGSFVPTIVSDVGEALDDKAREARGFGAQIEKRVPVVREGLPEAADVFGRPLEHRRTRSIDPTLMTTARDGSVESELQRLQVGVGTFKRRDGETEAERRSRLRSDGPELYRTLEALITSPEYQRMTDDGRRGAVGKGVRTFRARMTRERNSKERLSGQRGR